MRCLVTGGAGFIGSHTVDALLEKGYQVRILDNLSKPVHLKGIPTYIPAEAEFIEGDIRSKDDWIKALENVNVVFHFADHQDYMPSFSRSFHVNAVGTALLYEVIVEETLDIEKIIVASSQAVYGEGKYRCPRCNRIKYPTIRSLEQLESQQWEICCDECPTPLQAMWTNENRVNPQNQYAISKYTQEVASLSLGKRYCIPTCCLRYSIVQGPRQSIYDTYSGVCRIFAISQFFGKEPPIYEDGKQIRDFVNIHDVVSANLKALTSPDADYKVFNVGSGKVYTVSEFANIVSEIYGKNIQSKITNEFRYGDTRHIFSDISRMRELGWKPCFTPKDSIEEYINWLDKLDHVDDLLDQAREQMMKMKVIRCCKKQDSNLSNVNHNGYNRNRHRLRVVDCKK